MSAPLEWGTGTVQLNPLKLKPCSALNCTAVIHIRGFWGEFPAILQPQGGVGRPLLAERKGGKKEFQNLGNKRELKGCFWS